MKSFLVIGMGRFGIHLAKRLQALGNDVMIVDNNAEIINELAPFYTDAQIGDCTKESVLRSIGVNNFDVCFVAIGENFQSSLEITSLVKSFGGKHVVSKANTEIQAKFLLSNGADEVVYPERDIAEKLATRYAMNNVFDYVELTPEFSIFEIPIMDSWVGKSVGTIDVRRKYKINILAVKHGAALKPLPGADYIFNANDHIVVLGKASDVGKFSERISL